MFTKPEIFNLALGALLLNKTISDTDADKSVESRTLNVHFNVALRTAIEDMDLDALSIQKQLELVTTEPNDLWFFAYKYPLNCSFLRRIQSGVVKDVRSTRIPLKVGTLNGQKVIFTNQEVAIAEYIPNDFNLSLLSSSAGMAVAYKLAWLSAPLIAGKGANALRQSIQQSYIVAKSEAQEHDRNENANFDDDETMSEFVEARTE